MATVLLPSIDPERARHLAASFVGTRVLVVGDAMLDRFIVGRVTRISPEAPVPVVAFDHESHRIGGAANVAHNIAALGGITTLVATSGRDEAAAVLAEACRSAGIAPVLASDPARPTTTKVRVVTERNQQVARIDYEVDAEIADDVEQQIIAGIMRHADEASAIVVSDYLKGTITPRVMRAVVAAAAARGVPVLVDPKVPHIGYYAGATLVTPNNHEAESATAMRIRSDEEATAAARVFLDRAGCTSVLLTRGDQGMCLVSPAASGHLPAVAREVADVTGAGDTVIATMALALAVGASLPEAACLANEAAGIAVGRFGPSVVSPADLLQALDATAAG